MKVAGGWSVILGLTLLALFLAEQGLPIHSTAQAHPWVAAGVVLLAALAVYSRG